MDSAQPTFNHADSSKCLAEFIGTYFLVFTIGCCVLTNSVGAPLAIGAVLMVMIFSLGSVSGAHFNPAVSLSVLLTNGSSRQHITLRNFFLYVFSQCLGGWCGALSYYGLFKKTFTFAPVGLYPWSTVFLVETIFTMALCFVVLNVATTKKQKDNSYFGLAIGFTVTSAAIAIGGISMCCLNPAVALGVCITAAMHTGSAALHWFPLYAFTPLLSAALAAGTFYCIRKRDEFTSRKPEGARR